MPTFKQKIGILLLLSILLASIVIYWYIPWSDPRLHDNAKSFLSLIITIIGFSIAIYQLKVTEHSVRNITEKPDLILEVIPFSGKIGHIKIKAQIH